MLPVVFTDFRRELIARTLLDLLKIFLAAALASKLFFEFRGVVKLCLWLAIMAFTVVGVWMCPPKKPKE